MFIISFLDFFILLFDLSNLFS